MVGPRHITEFPTIQDSEGETGYVVLKSVDAVFVDDKNAALNDYSLWGFVVTRLQDFIEENPDLQEYDLRLEELAAFAYAIGKQEATK